MRDKNGRFQRGHSKPKNAWGFPSGELNPAKTLEVKQILSKQKLGKNNPFYGKHKSAEFKRKMSERLKGEGNHNWKGGITPINEKIRKSLEYKLWRTAVYERDDYACVFCGNRQAKGHKVVLNADHIKPFCDYPELRFAIDNGRTLCKKCHNNIGWKGNQFRCV